MLLQRDAFPGGLPGGHSEAGGGGLVAFQFQLEVVAARDGVKHMIGSDAHALAVLPDLRPGGRRGQFQTAGRELNRSHDRVVTRDLDRLLLLRPIGPAEGDVVGAGR